ncbi:MAG: calcium/sodium antiporter [archaeon]|nr:calcium/sodium antiporter [archaeon]
MFEILIFLASLLAVIKGAQITTESAINVAKKYGISEFLIGFTVIAVGTSLPELATSITAVMYGTPDIAVSNIIGSNIANIGLVVGITTILFSRKVRNGNLKNDLRFLIFSVLALIFVFRDGMITFQESISFLVIYFAYIIYSVKSRKMKKRKKEKQELKTSLILIFGLALLLIGSNYLISSAISIIDMSGISAKAFGFFFIAVGTSLPELATSIISIKKKHHNLAIGNIIGSNIFNTFLIFGTIGTIKTIPIIKSFYLETMPILIILTGLLYISAARKKVTRLEGLLFLLIYAVSVIRVF